MRYLTVVTVGLLMLGCGPSVTEIRDQAVAQYQLGHIEQAEMNLREVLDERPYDAEALYYMGRIQQDMGRPTRAIYYYQCCLDVDPSHEMARMWLRRAEQQTGETGRRLRFIPPDQRESGS
ncbi:MAG: tetratricopeptide repeat protein [Phycisphaerae bacterium]